MPSWFKRKPSTLSAPDGSSQWALPPTTDAHTAEQLFILQQKEAQLHFERQQLLAQQHFHEQQRQLQQQYLLHQQQLLAQQQAHLPAHSPSPSAASLPSLPRSARRTTPHAHPPSSRSKSRPRLARQNSSGSIRSLVHSVGDAAERAIEGLAAVGRRTSMDVPRHDPPAPMDETPPLLHPDQAAERGDRPDRPLPALPLDPGSDAHARPPACVARAARSASDLRPPASSPLKPRASDPEAHPPSARRAMAQATKSARSSFESFRKMGKKTLEHVPPLPDNLSRATSDTPNPPSPAARAPDPVGLDRSKIGQDTLISASAGSNERSSLQGWMSPSRSRVQDSLSSAEQPQHLRKERELPPTPHSLETGPVAAAELQETETRTASAAPPHASANVASRSPTLSPSLAHPDLGTRFSRIDWPQEPAERVVDHTAEPPSPQISDATTGVLAGLLDALENGEDEDHGSAVEDAWTAPWDNDIPSSVSKGYTPPTAAARKSSNRRRSMATSARWSIGSKGSRRRKIPPIASTPRSTTSHGDDSDESGADPPPPPVPALPALPILPGQTAAGNAPAASAASVLIDDDLLSPLVLGDGSPMPSPRPSFNGSVPASPRFKVGSRARTRRKKKPASTPGVDPNTLPDDLKHLAAHILPDSAEDLYTNTVLIGEGECGDVYCADEQRQNGGKVAIKVVRGSTPAGQARLAHLGSELALWGKGGSNRIIGLVGVYLSPRTPDPEGVIWLVQELLDRSVADVITAVDGLDLLTEEHMARIILDTTSALAHLHQVRIVHCDCRSDNLLIGADGVTKLTDFTHATHIPPGEKRTSIVGTPFWMAPEVITATPYAFEADIWSLSAVLWELVEKAPPYVDLLPRDAVTAIVRSGMPPLSADGCSEPLRAFLADCSAMDPSRRPTAMDLLSHPFLSSLARYGDMARLLDHVHAVERDQISGDIGDEDGAGGNYYYSDSDDQPH